MTLVISRFDSFRHRPGLLPQRHHHGLWLHLWWATRKIGGDGNPADVVWKGILMVDLLGFNVDLLGFNVDLIGIQLRLNGISLTSWHIFSCFCLTMWWLSIICLIQFGMQSPFSDTPTHVGKYKGKSKILQIPNCFLPFSSMIYLFNMVIALFNMVIACHSYVKLPEGTMHLWEMWYAKSEVNMKHVPTSGLVNWIPMILAMPTSGMSYWIPIWIIHRSVPISHIYSGWWFGTFGLVFPLYMG